jgi:hypothetical protein
MKRLAPYPDFSEDGGGTGLFRSEGKGRLAFLESCRLM